MTPDMSEKINFTIDGKQCAAEKGTNLVDAAKDNGVYIPTLCHVEGLKPAGSCRICNVKINGRYMTACTTSVADGMVIADAIRIEQLSPPPAPSAAPESGGSEALELLARWAVALEIADSSDGGGDAEEDDLAAVDHLFGLVDDE